MKKQLKKHLLLFTGLMLITLLSLVANVHAQPVIINADFYTDNWGPNALGWVVGHHFVACACVSGYKDPENELTVFAKDENAVEVELFYDWGNWFCGLVENDLAKGGVLTITATSADGAYTTKDTCNLDNVLEIPLAENIRYSYDASSNLPVISWNMVENAQRYFVRFYYEDIDGYQELSDCRSPSLRNPSYEIPNNLPNCNIAPNNNYIVRILSQNYDECDQYDSGYGIENRSSTWADFIPPPESEEININLDPNTLNRKSRGNFLTCYIEIPEEYEVDADNIRLVVNGIVIPAESWPKEWDDYDSDGIMELMVKFDRQEFIKYVDIGEVDVTVNIDTTNNNNILLHGSNTIHVK